MTKPTAFVHVDVDGLWAVRRCYGIAEGNSLQQDPVWESGVPTLARLFEELQIPATFFLVGRDLFVSSKRKQVRQLHESGFELGNHSFSHKLGITRLSNSALEREIVRTHRLIEHCNVPAPIGFRAPGYDVDERVLQMLRMLSYRYDSSVLPTFLSPLLRVADAVMARRVDWKKRQFGQLRYALAPRRPYVPSATNLLYRSDVEAHGSKNQLVEFPVSVITRAHFPLTASAIFALGPERVCGELERKATAGEGVLFLLHGIDAVDCSKPLVFPNRTPSTGGFNLSLPEKQARIRPVLQTLLKCFSVQQTRYFVRDYKNFS